MIVISDGWKLCGLSFLLARELWAPVFPTSSDPCYTLLQVLECVSPRSRSSGCKKTEVVFGSQPSSSSRWKCEVQEESYKWPDTKLLTHSVLAHHGLFQAVRQHRLLKRAILGNVSWCLALFACWPSPACGDHSSHNSSFITAHVLPSSDELTHSIIQSIILRSRERHGVRLCASFPHNNPK